MAHYERILKNVAEKLLDDERLRANLTDAEAKLILDWGIAWLTAQVNHARDETTAQDIARRELARVRQAMSALNVLARQPGVPRLSDAVAALDAPLQASPAFTRAEVFGLLTGLTSAAWHLRARK